MPTLGSPAQASGPSPGWETPPLRRSRPGKPLRPSEFCLIPYSFHQQIPVLSAYYTRQALGHGYTVKTKTVVIFSLSELTDYRKNIQ